MRRSLGVLRRPDAAAPLTPQPGMDGLDALVEQARESGLTVELVTEGTPCRCQKAPTCPPLAHGRAHLWQDVRRHPEPPAQPRVEAGGPEDGHAGALDDGVTQRRRAQDQRGLELSGRRIETGVEDARVRAARTERKLGLEHQRPDAAAREHVRDRGADHAAADDADAGVFGPNVLDATFGPEAVFIQAPPLQNTSPADGYQFFGHVAIDGESRRMTVSLRDLDGAVVFSVDLDPPHRHWRRV